MMHKISIYHKVYDILSTILKPSCLRIEKNPGIWDYGTNATRPIRRGEDGSGFAGFQCHPHTGISHGISTDVRQGFTRR
jgi:hypothetical protein